MKFFSKKNKNIIDVNISCLGNYINWEFNDLNYNIVSLPKLYNDILKFLLSEMKLIFISQFFDEDQGLSITKEHLLQIKEDYHLEIFYTKSYSESHKLGGTKKSYVINCIGNPIPYWLGDLTFFGGTSLSNIIFGFTDRDQLDKNEINELNKKFTNWYWLKSNFNEIETLRQNSSIMCWTSDSKLNLLLDSQLSQMLQEYIYDSELKFPCIFTINHTDMKLSNLNKKV